jgi:paraquat-inducible protein A
MASATGPLRACSSCGLIQRLPGLGKGQAALCVRCGAAFRRSENARRSISRTAAAATGALVLFFPAVLLPIIEIEQLGHRHASSLLVGIVELLAKGNWLVGGVVLVFSILFPLAKLLLLLELSFLEFFQRRHKAVTFRLVEHVGKWSMMDVLLLALLVMVVKLGSLVSFAFGPAVIAFILCVVLSMTASLSFDPHAIWEIGDDEPARGGEAKPA